MEVKKNEKKVPSNQEIVAIKDQIMREHSMN